MKQILEIKGTNIQHEIGGEINIWPTHIHKTVLSKYCNISYEGRLSDTSLLNVNILQLCNIISNVMLPYTLKSASGF